MRPVPAHAQRQAGARLPASGQDSGMAQVLTWLFADGSSSVADQDGAAVPQDMSVSSLRVRPCRPCAVRCCRHDVELELESGFGSG